MKKLFRIPVVALMIITFSCMSTEEVIITKVYVEDEGRSVRFDTKQKSGNLLLRDSGSVFSVLCGTEDNKWIVIEKAPSSPGEGRVQTEQLLFYLPENRWIDIEAFNPALSAHGLLIDTIDGAESLMVYLKGSSQPMYIPLSEFLKQPLSVQEPGPVAAGKEETVENAAHGNLITIPLGTEENSVGQGMVELMMEEGRYVYAIPSYAAHNGRLYIVDAMNSRVMVYDYQGNYIKKTEYLKTNSGSKTIFMRDIAVDNEFIYLLSDESDNKVYVIDAETEDVVTILDGTDTGPGRFGAPFMIETDKQGNLLVVDTHDNTLYTYKKNKTAFSLLKSEQYTGTGQLAAGSNGVVYEVITSGNSYEVTASDGRRIAKFTGNLEVAAANVIATDNEGNIYIRKAEGNPQAQSGDDVYIEIVSPEGALIGSFNVRSWPGGPMTRYYVTDKEGAVFEAWFELGEYEPDPPPGFVVRRVK